MKICILTDKNRYIGFSRFNFDEWSKVLYSKIFFEFELSESDFDEINSHDCILCRSSLHLSTVKKIKIPIVFLDERAHTNYFHIERDKQLKKYKNQLFYLTDINYVFNPQVGKFNFLISDLPKNLNYKKSIDVLMVASSKKYSNHNVLFNLYGKKNKNNFHNLWKIYQDSFLMRKFEKKKFENFGFFLDSVKYYRRLEILKELNKIGNKYKIKIVGDWNKKKYKNLNFQNIYKEGIINEFKKAKIAIILTPNHKSILNERFHAAIKYGCIPICEPYPQYEFLPNEFIFDYKKKTISGCISAILDQYGSNKVKIDLLKPKILEKFGKENFLNDLKNLIHKKSITSIHE